MPPVPDDISVPALERAQFDSVRSQVPMLLSVAALNTIIIMAVCANDGLPVSHYGWMSILVLYCAVRIAFWIRQLHRPIEPHAIPRLLRMNMGRFADHDRRLWCSATTVQLFWPAHSAPNC